MSPTLSPPTYTPLSGHDSRSTGVLEVEGPHIPGHDGLKAAVPTLRGITLIVAFILPILCPIAFTTAKWKTTIIAIIPALLSAILALGYFIRCSRTRKNTERKHSTAGTIFVFLCDAFLMIFHLGLTIGVNHQVHRSYRGRAEIMLGTWIGVFLLVDTIIHLLCVLEALPRIFIKFCKPKPCARCGYSGSKELDGTGMDNMFDPLIRAANDNKSANRTLHGNVLEESDFGDSARPSEDTIGNGSMTR